MIGEVIEWSAARRSGLVQPLGEPDDRGWYLHGGAFGNKPLPLGTRISFEPWVSAAGVRMAVNASLASAEADDVYLALG